MSRKAKGKRPVYFTEPENDGLLAIVMALAGELSVLHDRVDTFERIVASRGVLTCADIENYVPDHEVETAREKWRGEYLDRVLRIVQHDLESALTGETQESYKRAVETVSAV